MPDSTAPKALTAAEKRALKDAAKSMPDSTAPKTDDTGGAPADNPADSVAPRQFITLEEVEVKYPSRPFAHPVVPRLTIRAGRGIVALRKLLRNDNSSVIGNAERADIEEGLIGFAEGNFAEPELPPAPPEPEPAPPDPLAGWRDVVAALDARGLAPEQIPVMVDRAIAEETRPAPPPPVVISAQSQLDAARAAFEEAVDRQTKEFVAAQNAIKETARRRASELSAVAEQETVFLSLTPEEARGLARNRRWLTGDSRVDANVSGVDHIALAAFAAKLDATFGK